MRIYTTDMPVARSGRIKVEVTGFAVSSDESTLTTSGPDPYIGIALYDPETGASGLAHAVPPEVDDGSEPTKFVNTDVELLITEIQAIGAGTDRIVARVAREGTISNFTSADGGGSIGDRSVAVTRTTLGRPDIDVIAEDVNGSHDRSPEPDSEADDFRVRNTKSSTYVL